MQNLHGISQIRRRNHIALTWVIRVISSGHHNSDGISILPLQRRKLVQSASGHRVENPCQRSLEQRKQRLGFRISKAAVEFNNRWSLLTPRQTGIQKAGVRSSAVDHFFRYRLTDFADNAVHSLCWQPRKRGVSTHAAGVWSLIIVVGTLVILRWQQRHDSFAIHQAKQ